MPFALIQIHSMKQNYIRGKPRNQICYGIISATSICCSIKREDAHAKTAFLEVDVHAAADFFGGSVDVSFAVGAGVVAGDGPGSVAGTLIVQDVSGTPVSSFIEHVQVTSPPESF